jgi:hypothetical protein
VRLVPTWDRSTDFSAFYASWFYAKMRQEGAPRKEVTAVTIKSQS